MRNGALSAKQALPLFTRLADGLALAHARGVVHRDIKPGNIMLRAPNGSPVLVDFGLASAGEGAGLTKTGLSAGYTPMFAAPEQLRGKAADARSDVYCLAATMYYALNYDKPDLREPDQYEPEHAPEALREALTRALHPKPERRYANAGEFRTALNKPAPPPPPNKPQRRAGDIYTTALGMRFAWIPPGTFLMGSPANEPERSDDETQHGVTLTKGFHLGIHQVTQAQWQAVMGNNPSHFKGESNLPVENVSWEDCTAFCEALGKKDGKTYRLPTEAEWEYACRAGTTTPFHFGGTISTNQANYDGNSIYGSGKKGAYRQKTTPVGSFPANAWGLYDMHGNVWEWCADWFGPHPEGELKDPQGGINGEARVVHGGSWYSQPGYCRAAYRNRRAPDARFGYLGCRVALCLD